jgi:DNA gyrase subunit A
VTRRSKYELDKHKAKAHILEGLIKAIENIDEVVATIKASKTTDEANISLQTLYSLSPEQSKAILDMRLHKITNLETDKIRAEVEDIRKAIIFLESILNSPEKLDNIIIEELEKIKDSYGDARRSRIEMSEETIDDIDLIPNDDVVITLTQKGYVKRVKMENYAVQHRGGRGKKGSADLSEHDDFIQDAFVARNHDNLLFFTNKGRVFSQMVFKIPEGSRLARGRAIVNILPLTEGETVLKLLPTRDIEDKFMFMITRNGVIKKTPATAFKKVRSTGIIALDLREGDELAFCSLSGGSDTVIVATDEGQGIRFQETEVRAMGRQAAGVKGINTKKSDAKVIGLEIIEKDTDCSILFATSRGYGKQVLASDFRIAHRGGMGVKTIPVDKRNGKVIGMIKIEEGSSLLLLDKAGKIIRLNPDEIRTMRRGAKGVRLIKLDSTQKLTSVIAFKERDEEEEDNKETQQKTNVIAAEKPLETIEE